MLEFDCVFVRRWKCYLQNSDLERIHGLDKSESEIAVVVVTELIEIEFNFNSGS